MSPTSLVLAIFLMLSALWLRLATAQTSDPALEQGQHQTEEAPSTLDPKALSEAEAYFWQLAQQHPERAIYFYELARVNYYRGIHRQRQEKRRASARRGHWERAAGAET